MNFGGPKTDTLGTKDQDAPPRPSAAPPPCPRCELVKSQCTKTIINYQKSHRKKIEALRAEVKSARIQVESLQRQLRGYKVASRLAPAVAALAVAGWVILKRLRGLKRGGPKGESPPQDLVAFMPPPSDGSIAM
ncbi:hypothetical protein Vretimale_9253 [Volvox reticuliferus]|uniref:Uncharacterized protein n=1 Tax=Volvox reticuliferus TaxID=1737510 RepID=A0A8J4LQ73_9CHLO|nr:hypothetical protein Vretifemale_10217 [Volvox reticuliferus]GIM04761.1 hypothetical protein Vretimale_9253 [Volvox reticuliferus]